MKIYSEKEFRAYQIEMEALTAKGTNLGDMELLNEEEKERYIALSQAISEWEATSFKQGVDSDHRCLSAQR